MYNKSSGAIIYKLLVSSAVCVYSVLVPVSLVPVAGTSLLVPETGQSDMAFISQNRDSSIDVEYIYIFYVNG